MHYYWFVQKAEGFYGLVYRYDSGDPDREIKVWSSGRPYETKDLAIEAAATYVDESGIEAEMGN